MTRTTPCELIFFTAADCPHCPIVAETLDVYEKDDPDIKISRLSADNKKIRARYKVICTPTIIVMKDEHEHERILGPIGQRSLHKRIARMTGKAVQ